MGQGVEDDDEVLSRSYVEQTKEDDVEEDDRPEWARGAKSTSKFDEYYHARIAKNKRPERPNRVPSP